MNGVIANYPLLVSGGNINFAEAVSEPKFGGANASMGDALNLDQGGSTALWFGGYKAGPECYIVCE